MSRGQFQSRSRFGRPPMGRCKRGKSILVDVIDVDHSESSDEVLIDVPGSSYHRYNGSKTSKRDRKANNGIHVISIVDEEDHDDLDSDASSGKSNRSNLNQSHITEELDGNDCQILEGRSSKNKFPNGFGTCHESGPCRSHYGLYMNSDSSSFESDGSDCEVMEDFSGKIREQWEKAAFRRQKFEDQTSASDPNPCSARSYCHKNISAQTSGGSLHSDISAQSSSSDRFEEKMDFYGNLEDPFVKLDRANSPLENIYGMEQGSYDAVQADINRLLKEMFSDRIPSPENLSSSKFSCYDNKQDSTVKTAHLFHVNNESGPSRETQAGFEKVHNKKNVVEEPVSSAKIDEKGEAGVGPQNEGMYYDSSTGNGSNSVPSQNKVEVINCRKAQVSTGDICLEKEELVREEQMIHQGIISDEKVKADKQSDNLAEVNAKRTTFEQRDLSASKEASLVHNETVLLNQAFNSGERCSGEPFAGNGNVGTVHNDLIGGREKLKETEEYRRAEEEEWASRQLQLQIQAEEAQRLRKRKKAETLRLLDMERRQKQRVEEMRETQKKDEETINLKEQLRVKIRKELAILEVKYRDMASLLRVLGIPVGGGFYPSPSEVNTAYKKALLKFHPDRTSSSNVQLQVEAEEKFKLITRLREKFLLTA